MRPVPVEEAVGQVLAHDLTRIVRPNAEGAGPAGFKGAAFKKGHIVSREDLDALKDMGKFTVFIVDLDRSGVHEDAAAERIARAAAGPGLYRTIPSEGKVNLKAAADGLLVVDLAALEEVTGIESVVFSTLHSYTLVAKDRTVAGTKVVPLVVDEATVAAAESACARFGPVVSVRPLAPLAVGIVVTGREVAAGRVVDAFGPILTAKVKALGGTVTGVVVSTDEVAAIEGAIRAHLQAGADLVLVSGGMSVDSDDVTPTAIAAVATEIVSYGSSVLPGAMFMTAYAGETPVFGVPACGMYNKVTMLDLLLPRAFAGVKIDRPMLRAMAHGGLCLGCDECRYPVCPFGK
jgi:molybdenum cofactor synthesis domain-containing protein